jgi:hypothetical protein
MVAPINDEPMIDNDTGEPITLFGFPCVIDHEMDRDWRKASEEQRVYRLMKTLKPREDL